MDEINDVFKFLEKNGYWKYIGNNTWECCPTGYIHTLSSIGTDEPRVGALEVRPFEGGPVIVYRAGMLIPEGLWKNLLEIKTAYEEHILQYRQKYLEFIKRQVG